MSEGGRLGGLANTPAQQHARQQTKPGAGRKPTYRIAHNGTPISGTVILQHRDRDSWFVVTGFTPAMLLYIGTWLRATLPKVAVVSIEQGVISYRKV